MVRIRILLFIITFVVFQLIASWAFAAGGQQMKDGALRRSWQAIPAPAALTDDDRAWTFVHDHAALLGLDTASDITLNLSRTDDIALGKRYVFHQTAHGLPVFEASLVLVLQGPFVRTLFNELSGAAFPAVDAALSAGRALQLAERQIENLQYRAEPSVELGYTRDGRLVYRVRLPGRHPDADWEIWLDARSGEILRHVDRRIFIDGTGRIFDPDPKTATEDPTLTDQNDSNAAIPAEAYSNVVLYDLDPPVGNYYYLDGPFVSTWPTANRAAEVIPEFNYWREDDRFEEVMTYYHIDHTQRYFQDELLTYNANNRQQPCNVNGTTDDNSWYSPYSGQITYGSGGVDDAEDADVIIHEYGHAVQDNINPNWTGGHTGAMGEGFGDYLAGSYSLTVNPDFQPDWVFNWDGHNEFWDGRILNANYHYPEDASREIHDAGQLWSAGLIDIWWDIPDVVAWDRIILQHHFLLGNYALMEDAAEAILTTELDLYSGIYRAIILENFTDRGFIDPGNYYPVIAHDPLTDTEDTLATAFDILSEITSAIPLDAASLMLYWRVGQTAYTGVQMTPTGIPDEYLGVIPGPFNGQTISYYLTAADTIGIAGFLPAGAPTQTFQFYVGPDPYAPEITWTDSLGETIFPTATFPVTAVATDNIGIAAVDLFWRIVDDDWQSTPMTEVAPDTFTAELSYQNAILNDIVEYFVRATDASSMANSADGPIQSFRVSNEADLDDFEGPFGPWIFTGMWGPTTQYSHSGSTSIEDSPGAMYEPNSDSWAEWDVGWDLSYFSTITLNFWEKHLLQEDVDFGRLEVSTDGGPWESLLEITGSDIDWYYRQVVLDDYCGGACSDLRFRFRTITDATVNLFGWFIDDLSVTAEIIVPVTETPETPDRPHVFAFGPAYPNPFNPLLTIDFTLPAAAPVHLTVYNLAGQQVAELLNTTLDAGIHQAAWNASGQASGLYLLKLQAGPHTALQKVMLLK